MQSRVGGGKIELLAGNVHHRQIVLPEIPTGGEGLELGHLKAQTFEVGRGQADDLIRVLQGNAGEKVGIGESHAIHDHVVCDTHQNVVEILGLFGSVRGKAVMVLAVLVAKIAEVHSILGHDHIGYDVISEKIGLGQDGSDGENVLRAKIGEDDRDGGCHDVAEHDDHSTFTAGAIVECLREFDRKGCLTASRRPPYGDQLTHSSPPRPWRAHLQWDEPSGSRPEPGRRHPPFQHRLGTPARNARWWYCCNWPTALPVRG